MIIGIGIDLQKIKRIQRFEKSNKLSALIKRVLTPLEIERMPKEGERRIAFLAKRFAAKEAFSKALGVGISKEFSFQDVAVINDEKGKPHLVYFNSIKEKVAKERLNCQLSLSDEKKYALAFVLIEKMS